MKKFLKIFLIVVLVGLAIGGTCYAFYSNIEESQDAYARVNTFMNSSERTSMNNKLNNVSQSSSGRLSLGIEAIVTLDSITLTLNTYMISSLDYDINNNSIVERLDSAIEKREELIDDADEYLLKTNNQYFDKSKGANDVFKTLSSYVVRYADMVKYMNNEIKSRVIVNKYSDIKFDVIELYCLTVTNTFSNLEEVDGLITVKNSNNFTLLNDSFYLVANMLSTTVGYGSYLNNKFCRAFNSIDKTAFANNLYTNVSTIGEITEASSNVDKATYYLKEILNLTVQNEA